MSEWEEKCYGSFNEAEEDGAARDEMIQKIVLLERQAFALALERISATEGLGFDFFVYGVDDARIRVRWKKELVDHWRTYGENDLKRLEISEKMAELEEIAEDALIRLAMIDREGVVEAAFLAPAESVMNMINDQSPDEPDDFDAGGWSGFCQAGSAENIARSLGWPDVVSRIESARLDKIAEAPNAEREKKSL